MADKERVESTASLHSRRSGGSSGTGDFGSHSEIFSTGSDGGPESNFTWKSQWQHAMFFIAYTFSWGSFSSYRKIQGLDKSEDAPNWFQIMVVYVFFGGPLVFLEVFIGQYTQKGCLVVGAMLPLAYGIGYSILFVTFISCAVNIYFSSSILYYTLIALINYPTPTWMTCIWDYNISLRKKCFSRDDIDLCESCLTDSNKPCFDPDNAVLSASIFKDVIIFGIDPQHLRVSKVITDFDVIQAIHMALIVVVVLCFATRSLRELDGSIRIWNVFTVVSIVVTSAVLLLNHPRLEFLKSMLKFNLQSLVNYRSWALAFTSTVYRLKLLEGGHFLFGSYLPITVNCTARVIYLLGVHLIVLLIYNVQAYLMEDYLSCSLNVDNSVLDKYSDVELTFSVYPMALGILAAAQLWATLYFLILLSLTVHTIVLQIIVLQETLCQDWIDPVYYIYLRVILAFGLTGIMFVVMTTGGFNVMIDLFIARNLICVLLLSAVYIVLLIYGMERLKDDIHFVIHSRPSMYLKLSWTIGAIATVALVLLYSLETDREQISKNTLVVGILVFLPIPIGFLFQFFLAVKTRDFSLLMKPTKSWGPQDVDEKNNRKLFNPRYEVRFRRRFNTCKHRCLMDSGTLQKTLEKELALLTNVLLEVEDNAQEKIIEKNFINALRKHTEIMTNALNFKTAKEYFTPSSSDDQKNE